MFRTACISAILSVIATTAQPPETAPPPRSRTPAAEGQDRQPTFAIIESAETRKHISVQPKDEHYRVSFAVQVNNAAGRDLFAEIRCKAGADTETVQRVQFKAEKDSEEWRVWLWTSVYTEKTARYQLNGGVYDPSVLNPDQFGFGYVWEVVNSPDGIKITDKEEFEGRMVQMKGVAEGRVFECVGGTVRVFSRREHFSPDPLIIGLDTELRRGVRGSGVQRVP